MPKLIETIHNRVNEAILKGHTGYFSPDTIDNEIHAEVLNIWRKYVTEFEDTRIINTYLNPFIKTEDVTPNPTNGSVALVNAKHYPIAVRVKSTGKPVKEVDQARWDYLINHPIETPNSDYPICKFESGNILARPIDIGELTISYIKKPVKAKYAYTIVSDRYVYDDVNSIDVEFDEILHDDIMMRVLSNLGIPMNNELLIRVSDQNKIMEGK